MGIFSFLTAGPKIVNDVFDKDSGHLAKFGAWVGNQQFTDQERAEYTHKFVVDTLSENTDRSKSRRHISKLIIRFYLGLLTGAAITFPFNAQWSSMLFDLSMSTGVVMLVTGVSAFFFGTHMLRSTKWGNEETKK